MRRPSGRLSITSVAPAQAHARERVEVVHAIGAPRPMFVAASNSYRM